MPFQYRYSLRQCGLHLQQCRFYDEECECGCHGEHHHHHDHDEECECGCHGEHHHHDHGEECECGCHGEHHHHHADEVFVSVGIETAKKYSNDELSAIFDAFDESDDLGMVLRAKGIVEGQDGKWIHFDYVPGESDIRYGSAGVIGRICVIGSCINKERIKEMFRA